MNTGDHDDVRSPATRAARILLAGAVLGVVSVLAVGCGSPSYPGEPLETLPPHTAGAVSLGGLGVETSGGRTLVFAFDDQGTVLGRLEGERIDATRVLFSDDSLVTVTGEAVTALTEQGRTDIPIDEHTISAMSHNPVSGAATVWFVRGRANNFVSVGADQQVRHGSVDGMVHTAAYCGDRQFAIIEDISTATGPRTSRFYELPASGEVQLRGQWQTEPDHSWASSTSVCASDGRSVLAFNADYSAASMNAGGPAMTLVSIDIDTGIPQYTTLQMPEGGGGVLRGTLSVVEDRLYWLNPDKQVLSVPVTGSPTVVHEWTVPGAADTTTVSVHDAVVTAVDYQDQPVLSRYDLRTGIPIGDPVELPWLDSIIGSSAGDTIYTLGSVTGTPIWSGR
ncbi:hypothetical protein MX572_26070 (plasmid) [Rhodococcus pyridinivorans]|uniref:hypothetical protein n=1 Tax=Rhodococcus pyridinivorans TaxID=103816 RepID=UPI0020C5BBD0|nr:hypothetical protein [Rhodococcus pyridinivorans]UTM40117.1 hypothetical protein MX572_26070 [Rhodococcus pyridinivorans]